MADKAAPKPEPTKPAPVQKVPHVTVRCSQPVSVREGIVFAQKFAEGEHSVPRSVFERYLRKTGHFELVGGK